MTTATAATPREWTALSDLMLTLQPGRRVTIAPLDWEGYEYLSAVRSEYQRRGIRLGYDRGALEIMTTTNRHERLKHLLDLLVMAWLEETGGRVVPSGGLTISRRDLDRGFEPDQCYYLQNVDRVLGLRELDFTVDPPPDLVIEIEVSRMVTSRLPVMAAFKVPEVWRYDGDRITVLRLGEDGAYHDSASSLAIPDLPLGELARFLVLGTTTEFMTISRQFREWVRSRPQPPAA